MGGVSFPSQLLPSHPGRKSVILKPIIRSMTMSSLFTNNTVHYKPGSLATGGVGTVRNARSKMQKT